MNRSRVQPRRNPGWAVTLLLPVVWCAQAAEPLKVTQTWFRTPGELQPSDWALQIEFSHPVSLRAVLEHVTFERNAQPAPLAFRRTLDATTTVTAPSNDEAIRSIVVGPTEARPELCWNRITIKSGLRDASGERTLEQDVRVPFDSRGTCTIVRIEADPEGKEARIHFDAPMDIRRLRDGLRLVPPIQLFWYDSRLDSNVLYLRADYQHGQQYLVSLPDDLRSANGLPYVKSTNIFTMPDLPPKTDFATTETVIERDSRQMLHVDVVNIEQLLFEGIRIPPILASLASEIVRASGSLPLPDLASALDVRVRELALRLAGMPGFGPFFGQVTTCSEVYFPQAPRNERTTFSLPLSFRPDSDQGGLLLARLRRAGAPPDEAVASRLYRVTDLAITYKLGNDSLLVWTTSLRTGLPLSEVSLLALDKQNRAYALGTTNADGVLVVTRYTAVPRASLTGNASPDTAFLPLQNLALLVAATGRDCSLLAVDDTQSYRPANVKLARSSESGNKRAHLFTDRGVYRPGETVRFKGTLRQYSQGVVVSPASGEQYRVQVRDSRNEGIYEKTFTPSPFGTLYDHLDIASFANLGLYTMSIKSATGENALVEHQFRVEEVVPPRHYTEIRFRPERRLNKTYVNVQMEENVLRCMIGGRYYAGGPVKHGRVRWTVNRAATSFPQEAYPAFAFGYPQQPEETFLETGETILDASGETEVILPLAAEALSGMHGVEVTATVVDFDGRAAAATSVFQQQPPYVVGIAAPPEPCNTKDPYPVRVIVIGPDGQRVLEGTVRVSLLSRDDYYTRKRDKDGNVYWAWQEVWAEQVRTDVALRDGEAIFDARFNRGGRFLVRAEFSAPDGRSGVSGIVRDVRGYYYWDEEEVQGPAYDNLPLFVEKPAYAVGDVARLYIRPQRTPASLLLTLEREGVLEYRLLPVGEEVVSVPVISGFRPNVYLSVIATCPRGEFPVYQGAYDDQAPSFAIGTLAIDVRDKVEGLKIDMGTLAGDVTALPGQEMTLHLRVTDEQEQPIQAEVALGVVDEQVLALSAYKTPKLDSLLAFQLPLSVYTRELRGELQPQTPYKAFRNAPLTGGDGYDGYGRREPLESKLREDFDPVAFFDPAVRTDAQGNAQVSFRFPDTMTTYRVYAVACDTGSRFASLDRKIRVTKPFYMEPGLPRFLTRGDRFQFKTSAFNGTDRSGLFSFGLEHGPELDLRVGPLPETLGAFDRQLITIEGEAREAGQATLTFSGQLDAHPDALRVSIPVQSGYVTQYAVQYGKVKGQASIRYAFPAALAAVPPDTLDTSDLSFELTLSGSPFLGLQPGLQYLMRYPYGCIEQTSSGTLPLASLRGLIQEGLIPGISLARTDEYLRSGVERIFSMQTSAGGFAYWPRSDEPSPWGTLYALAALVQAQRAGFELPQDRLNRAFDYLIQQTASDQSRDNLHDYGVGFHGMAALLLAQADRLPRDLFDRILARQAQLGREGQLLLFLAAQERGYIPPEQLLPLTWQALAGPKSDSGGIYRAVQRETAISLLAAHVILHDATEAGRYAVQLIRSIGADGAWTSTSDTGWALLALGEYLRGTLLPSDRIAARIIYADGEAQPVVVSATQETRLVLDSRRFVTNPKLDVQVEGPATLCYELALRYPRPDYAASGTNNGIAVSKTVQNLDGGDTIRVGDVVKVQIRLQVDSPVSFLVIDDPLPAGLVAINSALATEERVPPADNREEDWYWRYWDASGYYKLVPNHFELRDDRVLVFRDRVWQGKYEYAYYARAVCAGRFRTPPTKAQLMYAPDTFGYTPESTLTIAVQ